MTVHLEVSNLSKVFGGVVANNNVDMVVNEGEIVGLIGPNGAGKSTLFNCIAGFYPPTSGKVTLRGREIQGKPAYEVCKMGVARTFQIPKIFLDMTVLENTMVGAMQVTNRVSRAREIALETLEFTGLLPKANLSTMGITVADKKRLEVTRALATQPELIMLDEAMAGLTRVEQELAVELVRSINTKGITVILVEHVMEVVMPISQRVVVLDQGNKIAEDVPEKIVKDPNVIRAYLGERYVTED